MGTRLTRFVCASLPVRVGRAWEIGFVPSLRVERFGGLFGFDAKGDGADEVAGGLANGALEAGDAFEVFGAGPELGFGVEEAVEPPGARREHVDELALDRVLGMA